jgi:hypothetical protein
MDPGVLVDLIVKGLTLILGGFLVYGGFLVAGGGGFRRDAPEDAALPHLDLTHEL